MNKPITADPIDLTQRLVRCPSITPLDCGTLDIVADFLMLRGFTIERLNHGLVSNLYARKGNAAPHLCFAGHTDVVPAGEMSGWAYDPFGAEVRHGNLYGRGVVDMKGAIGAYLSALDDYLKLHLLVPGSLSVLLTTDEEGPGVDGIQEVARQLKARGERIDACIVGEPTNIETVGDMLKVGRRGSLNASLTIQGKAGHVAYPHLANNPIGPLLDYLQKLTHSPLDGGMDNFDPSHLEITSVECDNPTANVIPARSLARFNIRFNPLHTVASLTHYLQQSAGQIPLPHVLEIQASGEAFFCENTDLQNLLSEAVRQTIGLTPVMSTSGGTSDARFIKNICPVIEFGLVSATAHQANEHIAIEEIYRLKTVYQKIIETFFATYA